MKIDLYRSEENARLIAASPELLEACKFALKQFGDIVGHSENKDDIEAINMLNKALQKVNN